jgi:hypothetical protein
LSSSWLSLFRLTRCEGAGLSASSDRRSTSSHRDRSPSLCDRRCGTIVEGFGISHAKTRLSQDGWVGGRR